MSDPIGEHPPKPRIAFRVGVTGHRMDRLLEADCPRDLLAKTIHLILQEVAGAVGAAARADYAGLYSEGEPILRAISSLAEGTDRIFAKEANELKFELCCPMPFYQEEFEKDFSGKDAKESDSLKDFRDILDVARKGAGLTIFELDGDRSGEPEAYGAAGRIVLNQSDLLIAVWDGGAARGAGGTLDTMNEALRYYVPVICIDAQRPDQLRLMRARSDSVAAQGHMSETILSERHLSRLIGSIVHGELRPPGADRKGAWDAAAGTFRRFFRMVAAKACPAWNESSQDASGTETYLCEPKPSGNRGGLWKLFRNFVGDGQLSWPFLSTEDFAAQTWRDWPIASDAGPRPSPVADWVNRHLRDAFGWADGLADYYANAHRSAFVASYLLAALAVLIALLPVAVPPAMAPSVEPMPLGLSQAIFAAGKVRWFEIICAIAELIILGRVLVLLHSSRSRQWHERWTDYRLLAELIRELRFLVPLGGGKPQPRIPPHLEVYGNPAQTWMYWYVRAISRQTGIPAARATPDYMRDCMDYLDHVVGNDKDGQLGFHVRAEQRARNLDKRLRCTANLMFGLTIIGVALRLVLAFIWHTPQSWFAEMDRCLLIAAAVLPATGAALEGINNQGEFIRVAKRSAAMVDGFHRFAARIALLGRDPAPRLADVIPLSSNIAETMVAEVVDWRAVIIDR